MTGLVLQISPAAEIDIASAFGWYAERNGLAAQAFRDPVFEAVDRIAQAPLARPADAKGNRFRVPRRFPCSVCYEVNDSIVTVLAVAHHRRMPGYWRHGLC